MLTETRQISNLRSQDVSKEILSDLVRKNVAKFSDKFFHFQYATWEMCKRALNNYSLLKFRFLINTHTFGMYWKKKSPISIMQLIRVPDHIFYRNVNLFLFATAFFYYAAFFPLKGKLKYIIIRLLYEISNDII